METMLFSSEFLGTMVRFLICLAVNWVIISRLYYKKSHRRDFFFTFMLMSVAIFFLVYFMMGIERGKASMGVGLGLFGLFVIICLSVVHAMAEDYLELLLVDFVTLVTIWCCELSLKVRQTKLIQYDRIELIRPERRAELKADLEERTGLKILKVDVGGIDFLKDTAVLKITYEGDTASDVDGQFAVRKSQWREMLMF